MTDNRALADLSLEQKAALTSGADFWTTKAVGDVPSIFMTDGPHGVRKQRDASNLLGITDSVPTTCFPPAVALASSWDAELAERVGAALGEEAQAEGVAVLLGPGINIKRSPLCGRNFEYLSEDPVISGVLGAALVRGIQSQGVGTSLKHFAVNNQESDRMRVSADVDERPLREIYLRGFQKIVTGEQPWTVMCSYNKVNGVYASENPWLLNTVLRGEWGFKGVVVSDWGAVNNRVQGVAAGLDLEMPSSEGRTDAQLVAAVRAGDLAESVIDTAAGRVAALARRAAASARPGADYDRDAHHALAREVAGRSIVLLKNEDALLPLDVSRRFAVIGEFARSPRYQGAGSSQINPTRLDAAVDEIRALSSVEVRFAPGFTITSDADATGLLEEAVAAAAAAEVAVLFLGLPAADESEGFDREHIDLPANQLALLEAVAAVQPEIVVVLANGGVVEVSSWQRHAGAILEGWLLGQAGGGAIADVLYGVVNPSGRLAETIPVRLQDTAAYLDFPGERGHVRYGEGLFVGYRWFDARQIEPAYAFGHGLSYTSFDYRDLDVRATEAGLAATLTVTNTGAVAGREVVQLYTALPDTTVQRAPRELKGFTTVSLAPGESATVRIDVALGDLEFWDIRTGSWAIEGGSYRVEVGASSRDIRLSAEVELAGTVQLPTLSFDSTVGELMSNPIGMQLIMQAITQLLGEEAMAGLAGDPTMFRLMEGMPLGRLAGFPGLGIDREQVALLLAAANAPG